MASLTWSYIISGTSAALAKGGAMAAGFVSLFCATQLLPVAEFAGFALALTMVWLLSLPASLGLDKVLVYRLSRREEAAGVLSGGDMAVTALLTVTGLGALCGALLAVAAPYLAKVIAIEGVAFWLIALSPGIALFALERVCSAWHQSRHRPGHLVAIANAGEIARGAFMLLALMWGADRVGIAAATLAGYAAPLALFALTLPRGTLRRPSPISREDLIYGMKLLASVFTKQGTKRIDLMMVGFLSTALATADYAVASRIAMLGTMSREMLLPVFTPRIGSALIRGRRDDLHEEFGLIRSVTLFGTLLIAAILIAIGPSALALLGEFDQALPLLAILLCAALVDVSFGPLPTYLNMSGFASATFKARLWMLAGLIAGNALLIPFYGALGAALGTVAAFLGLSLWLARYALRQTGLKVWSGPAQLASGLAVATLVAVASGADPMAAALLLLVIAGGFAVVEQRRLFAALSRLEAAASP